MNRSTGELWRALFERNRKRERNARALYFFAVFLLIVILYRSL